MQLTGKSKIGIATFVLFYLLLIAVLVTLFSVRSERDKIIELDALGTTVLPEPLLLEEFRLTDQFGSPYTNTELRGHWTLMFFGFTSCPDICPLTMAELGQFYQRLDQPSPADELKVVMVTVDPGRDTPETMASYVVSFHEEFVGLSGDYDSISRLAAQLFVAHTAPPEHSARSDNYLIEHSGQIAVINPAGQFYAVMRPPHRDQYFSQVFEILNED